MATVRLTRGEASRGHLPEVCIVCGEHGDDFRSKNMAWHPPWIAVLILLGLLPFLIGVLLTQQKMHVQVPFCPAHRNHWSVRSLTTWLSFLGIVIVGVIIMAVFINLDNQRGRGNDAVFGFGCLAWVALLVAWIVLALVLNFTAVRPQEIQESFIILKGVHPQFIDALEANDDMERDDEDDRRRRRRRSRDREFADDDDAPPPRAARPDDAERYRDRQARRPRPGNDDDRE